MRIENVGTVIGMEDRDVEKTILEIRQKLMLRMNGAASECMVQRGISYRLNYGVTLPELQQIASGYRQDSGLANGLWRQECRECRMLAAMLYPASEFFADLADVWIDGIQYPDLAEVCCKFLFRLMPGASEAAFRWIASEDDMRQYCGFLTLAHLMRGGREMKESYVLELEDQAETAMASGKPLVREGASAALGIIRQRHG